MGHHEAPFDRLHEQKSGAGNEVRTRDLNLGKVALYQLSYSRVLLIVIGGRLASTHRLVSLDGLFLQRREKRPEIQNHRPQRQDHGQGKQK